jgi:hypothetical protein
MPVDYRFASRVAEFSAAVHSRTDRLVEWQAQPSPSYLTEPKARGLRFPVKVGESARRGSAGYRSRWRRGLDATLTCSLRREGCRTRPVNAQVEDAAGNARTVRGPLALGTVR